MTIAAIEADDAANANNADKADLTDEAGNKLGELLIVERRGGTSRLGVSLEEDNFKLLHFSIKSQSLKL